MTERTQLAAGGLGYLVALDRTSTWQTLVHGRAVDDVSGEPLGADLDVSVRRTGSPLPVSVRVLDGGLYCVAGIAARAFPDNPPNPSAIDLSFVMTSYQPARQTVAIPTPPTFPVDAGDVRLRPVPVRLQGRVVGKGGAAPVAGALVALVDEPHPAAPVTAHVLALREPLAAAHPDGAAVGALTAVGPPRQLTAPLVPSDTVARVDDRSGLSPGDVLLFAPAGPAAELGVPSPAVLAEPGAVQLTAPAGAALPAGTIVRAFRTAAGAARLAGTAGAGDGVVLLDSVLSAEAVLIAGPAGPEVRSVGAVTDDRGHYHLDGVGRVATVFVTASAPSLGAGPIAATIAYSRPVNIVDLVAI